MNAYAKVNKQVETQIMEDITAKYTTIYTKFSLLKKTVFKYHTGKYK